MRLIIRLIAHILILMLLASLIPYDAQAQTGVQVIGTPWQVYLAAGAILSALNMILRPILSILGIPFMILTFWAFTLVINAIILFVMTWIIELLRIPGVLYDIHGSLEFLFSVAIFTILNTLLSFVRL